MFSKRPRNAATDDGTPLSGLVTDTPAPRRVRQGRRLPRILLISLMLVLSAALVFVGFYLVTVNNALGRIKTIPSAISLPETTNSQPPRQTGVLNYVLLGTDSRNANDPGRSDTLMVAHVNKDRNQVYLISFPRDLYVEIPGHRKDKINAAYTYGGPALTVKTVQNILNVHVDHVAQIDLEGFVGLTDAIGGIDIFNPTPSKDHHRNCYPYGDIHLSGGYALFYVRQRYELPNGDLDRAQRQRLVTKAILTKMMRPEVLLNPPVFVDVLNKIADFVVVDETLTPAVIRDTALSMRVDSANDIATLQAPIKGFGQIGSGERAISIAIADEIQMKELGEALANDQMDEYYAKYGNKVGREYDTPSHPDSSVAPIPTAGVTPSPMATQTTTRPTSRAPKPQPSPIPSEIYCRGYNR